MLTRRQLLALAAAGSVGPLRSASPPPNILFILMDDMAQRALSCYGNPHLQTPHLDRLASQGMRFTDAYVTPQCTPTRSTLMTGQYTARNRMWHVIPWYGMPWARVQEPPYCEQLTREEFILPKGLKAAGYATACIGKWHLTTGADGNYEGLNAQASHYYGFDVVSGPAPRRDELRTGDKGVGRLTAEAIAFMRANRDRPFFCYLPHHTTHGLVTAPEPIVRKYLDRGAPAEGLANATYLAAVEYMDTCIGRLLEALDELNLADRTAVVFLTDNGGVNEVLNHQPVREGNSLKFKVRERQLESTPWRAGKGYAYEGGIRVPMIVRWPGVVKAGSVNRTPVHAVDILPTFLEMAATRVPAGHKLDGVSLVPTLRGAPIKHRPLYWYMPFYDLRWAATPSAAVRDGDFKLIEYFGDYVDRDRIYRIGNRLELYNLAADPGENNDLSRQQPAKVKLMQQQLHAWIRSCGAGIPGLNPRYDPQRCMQETREKPAI